METQKYVAELVGTFLLVFVGASAIVALGGFAANGAATIGYLGVALAFGLTLAVLVYTLGPISGGHFNPAVTIALAAARRFNAKDIVPYVVVQVIGAIIAAGVVFVIASGQPGWTLAAPGGLGETTFGSLAVGSAFVAELVLTFVLVWTVLAVTERNFQHAALGPLAIGLALLAIHIAGLGFTGASVNPARSLGPALLVGGTALNSVWLYIVAPIIGGLVASGLYMVVAAPERAPTKAKAIARA